MLQSPLVTRLHGYGPLITASLLFFGFGLVTAALGPALPELSVATGTTLGTLGILFTMIFLGALLTQTVSGPIMDRVGQRPVLLASVPLLVLGMGVVLLSRLFPLTVACALVAGLGYGGIDVGTNVLIAETYPRRSVSALNLLNLFFGIGAVVGPALAGLTLALWGTALPALWTAIAVLLGLVPFLWALPQRRAGAAVAGAQPHLETGRVYRVPALWLAGLLLFLYVGAEMGMGGWAAAFMNRSVALALDQAALVASGFWLMLTIGRILAALLGTRLSSTRVLASSLAGALLGSVLLLIGLGNAAASIAAILVLGLSCGPIFPTVLAVTAGRFHGASGKASSVVIAMGSTGGMIMPWLQGLAMESGGPRALAALVALGAAAMVALYGVTLLTSRSTLSTRP